MEEYKTPPPTEPFKYFMKKFWKPHKGNLYRQLYKTYHPSTYAESFTNPSANFDDALYILEDAVEEGTKLGLLNPNFETPDFSEILGDVPPATSREAQGFHQRSSKFFEFYPTLDNKLQILDGVHLDWVFAILLFDVFYDIVMEFRCYCGDYGIDPDCVGKCLDENLKKDYNTLYNFMLELKREGIPVEELLTPGHLEKIHLIDNPDEGYNLKTQSEDVYESRILKEAMDEDMERLLGNVDLLKALRGNDRILVSDFVERLRSWGRYNPVMTDLSPFLTDAESNLKGEYAGEILRWAEENNAFPPDYDKFFQEYGNEDLLYLWENAQSVRDALTRSVLSVIENSDGDMSMENVNAVFKTLARRLYTFILKGRFLEDAQERRRLNESKETNQPVEIGDVIQLLHMEDPWNPIPVATKGVVMGFESMGSLGEKILVRWIIDPKTEQFKNMPLLPDVDVYRKVKPPKETKENILKEEQHKEITYKKAALGSGKFNNILFFNGTSELPDTDTEIITLRDEYDSHNWADIEVGDFRISKRGGLYVVLNKETRPMVQHLIPDSFKLENIKNDYQWKHRGFNTWMGKVKYVIDDSLKEIYKDKDLGINHNWGTPTENHMEGILDFEVAEGSEDGWSILNFFNTNPVVRNILLEEYERHLKDNNLPLSFNIDEFTSFIKENKEKLFHPNSDILKKLTAANHSTWGYGIKNETGASEYLKKWYGDGYEVLWNINPGLRRDAVSGVDIEVKNKESGNMHTYQAKPLYGFYKRKNHLVVKSTGLKYYSPTTVDYFVFGPSTKGEVLIFKNEGQNPFSTKEMGFKTEPLVSAEPLNENQYNEYWT